MQPNPYEPAEELRDPQSTALRHSAKPSRVYAHAVRDGVLTAVAILLANSGVIMLIPTLFPRVPVTPKLEALEFYCYACAPLFVTVSLTVGQYYHRFPLRVTTALVILTALITWVDFQLLAIVEMTG